jgi:hypothetical protein
VVASRNPEILGLKFLQLIINIIYLAEELDGPAVSALRRAISEVTQRWSVIGWVTKNLLSRAPPWFGRHRKPLVPAALQSLAPTNPHWTRVMDYDLFSLYII